MFMLRSINLTGLGGMMGTERTSTNFRKYFKTLAHAKAYAEKDYKNPLKWHKIGEDHSTGDLRYVMYSISKLKTED